ncbi:MAG: aminodeoxychorismate synthase [Gracilibacter sp. BRH_c7a]|nr:MAG: aminodeoxychorismate synthase [Gracilibacter sp. BRH_c7a]
MIFMLDNFDSFTYNLYQYFGELGEEVTVFRPGEGTISDISALGPDLIVISPGPCSPNEAAFSLEVIDYFKGKVPILGICLGHQAVGQVFGANVIRAKTPVHGKLSLITHDGEGVFQDLANPLKVTRYHSLALERASLPSELAVTAQTADGEIMGIRHTTLPLEGVQFHPEAILTESGLKLLENAVKSARSWKEKQNRSSVWQVRPLAISLPPHHLVQAFRKANKPFFLDSGNQYVELGQHSYLGAFPFLMVSAYQGYMKIDKGGDDNTQIEYSDDQNALSILDDFLSQYQVPLSTPFPFSGGAVGFFSYDLKNEIEDLPQTSKEELGIPLWTLAWYDGILVYEHETKQYYLTACGMKEGGECDSGLARVRLDNLEEIIRDYLEACWSDKNPLLDEHDPDRISFELVGKSVPKQQYLKDLERVINYIYDGDIYQANLSQAFSLPYLGDPWELYYRLRQENSAPFSAFLPYSEYQILSTSPERFIRISPQGYIETRPIKGTRPRGKTQAEDEKLASELLNSEKDKAELTMIVDLERNDLGRICTYGSVKTKELIILEKYPAVWHLVATIVGRMKAGLKPSRILKAIFPGGSITGAPKIRAMEIIDELEPYKRGIYTGSIGYIGFDGAWDLNIVIRTILLKDGVAHVHAGGGIVADSVPEDEYAETIHKAGKLLEVLGVDLSIQPKSVKTSAK